MTDCIFCKIVQGEIPAEKVYEDDLSFALLDIHPLAPGHVMILPKEHGETILDVSDETAMGLNIAVKKVCAAIEKALVPDGLTIGINHRMGQSVPHLHVHILPRWKGDGGGNFHSIVNNPPKEDLSEIAEKIRSKI